MEEPNTKTSASHIWEESWVYIKTVVDTVREPFLVLDKDLNVLAANESFYRTFQVDREDTEGTLLYKLGNSQWDIPSLRKLLEDILPKNSFFKGYEVAHDFPFIGRKVMILNARQVFNKNTVSGALPPIILLAMEDITDLRLVADNLVSHSHQLEERLLGQIKKLEMKVEVLENTLLKSKETQV